MDEASRFDSRLGGMDGAGGGAAVARGRRPWRAGWLWLVVVLAAAGPLVAAESSEPAPRAPAATWLQRQGFGERRETAGWHLLRPGQDLATVARVYRGARILAATTGPAADLAAGARVRVELRSGLPPGAALLARLSGRVDAQPTPVPWLPGRRFDLLHHGDALRTFAASSAELSLADADRLLITEESLVFLDPPAGASRRLGRGEVEVVHGQADLEAGGLRRAHEATIEIVMGATRAKPRADGAGRLATRARHTADGEAQVMVYRGSSKVAAAGREVVVGAGRGTVVARGGVPAAPETLLPAPVTVDPPPATRRPAGVAAFRWGAVTGAASYAFELCRDPACAELVLRRTGLAGTTLEGVELGHGVYHWRVTATAPSRLDGFRSASSSLGVDPPAALPPEGRLAAAPVPPPVATAAAASLVEPLVVQEEIVVTPSRIALVSADTLAPLAFGPGELEALPHLGDDLFRAVPLLPGTTANDVAAQFHVRGGRRDEVAVRLDGQELYGAYHLKDFDNALSIVAPAALAAVELDTGAFSARIGDRMGGVLEMTTSTPPRQRHRLGLSLLTAQAGTAGTLSGPWGEKPASYLVLARRGAIDLAGRLFGVEQPRYWDVLAKLDVPLGERHGLTLQALHADDDLTYREVDGEDLHDRQTSHRSSCVWLSHHALVGGRAVADTMLSWSTLDSDRRAVELEDEQRFWVADRRRLDVGELRTDWTVEPTERHLVGFGLGARRFDAPYDYWSERHYATPLAALRFAADDGPFAFSGRFETTHASAYLTDRLRLSPTLALELGLRFDHHSGALDERHVSPRLNLSWSLGQGTALRAAWGEFVQSQRPYELQVEDTVTSLAPAERSRQWVLGFEHVVPEARRLGGTAVRLEVYRREIANPRVRFENLYEPYNTFPELEPDRVRVAPRESVGKGVELFVRGSAERPVGWWLNYTWSRMADRLDEGWVVRQIDQTHALNLALQWPLGERWRASLAWRYHTGWPTTPLSLAVVGQNDEEDDEDDGEDDGDDEPELELVPVLGALNSRRLPAYHRLDLRLSRPIETRRGRLTFYFDVQNLYDRKNPSGFEIDIDEETLRVVQKSERWPGIFPSAGLTWEF